MNRALKRMGITLSVIFVLVLSVLTFVQGENIVRKKGENIVKKMRSEGVVEQLDLKKRKMEVNERIITWNKDTIFNDEKGNPVQVDKLSTKSRVYIEGEYDKSNQVVAKKIYLLPEPTGKKERRRYPFMQ